MTAVGNSCQFLASSPLCVRTVTDTGPMHMRGRLATGVGVHRATRTDALAEALAEQLSQPLPDADPFTPEVVSVVGPGIERWLAQTISRRTGVSANIWFPHPSELATTVEQAIWPGQIDPRWRDGRIVWALLDILTNTSQEWAAVPRRHLGVNSRDISAEELVQSAYFELPQLAEPHALDGAQRIAQLFDSYLEQRPAMLLDWANGDASDGVGGTLPNDQRWQFELWVRLREQLGRSPVELLSEVTTALADDPSLVGLPARLSVFGVTRLSIRQLAVLHALSAGRQVDIWLPSPSRPAWDAVQSATTFIAENSEQMTLRRPVRAQVDCRRAINDPLLAAFGRDSREVEQILLATAPTIVHEDEVHPPTFGDNILGRLQQRISSDGQTPSPMTGWVPSDNSLRIHACHGRMRQVEVLRELVLHDLSDDPTLQPRDILVMCPDVESFAPLLESVFGGSDLFRDADGEQLPVHPGHELELRLADRSLQQLNPLIDLLATVLANVGGRWEGPQVFDVLGEPSVLRAFDLGHDDTDTLRQWLVKAGLRWGFDAEHRREFGLMTDYGTWAQAIDQLVAGYAVQATGTRWLNDDSLPLSDVSFDAGTVIGSFAEFIDRLQQADRELREPATVQQWIQRLLTVLDRLTLTARHDGWQRAHIGRVLTEAAQTAGKADDRLLTLADIRDLFAGFLRGQPARNSFRSGHLTICTLMPMRSVPHRVIYLLGMDLDEFPRRTRLDGSDILSITPQSGNAIHAPKIAS